MKSSTLVMRSLRCRLPFFAGAKSSGISWLIQGARRRWQPIQVASSGAANKHLIFRLLHSQQDLVPLRSFLRFADDSGSSETPSWPSTVLGVMAAAGSSSGLSILLARREWASVFVLVR